MVLAKRQVVQLAFLAFLQLVTGVATAASGLERQLQFKAEPLKQRFAQGEPVQFLFQLRNVGTRETLVFDVVDLEFSVYLEITGPGGEPVPWCGPIRDFLFQGYPFEILAPGEAIEAQETISCVNMEQPVEERRGYAISTPGKYAVKSIYQPIIRERHLLGWDGKKIPFYRDRLDGAVVEFIIEASPESPSPSASIASTPTTDQPLYRRLNPFMVWFGVGALAVLVILYVTRRKHRTR